MLDVLMILINNAGLQLQWHEIERFVGAALVLKERGAAPTAIQEEKVSL